uniref:LIM and calponin homology domains 1a n=1 Tax=Oryzias latipes TaxID=8090 RepID=A0A3P9L202_ORYLA
MASPAACKTLSSAPPRALLEANHHPEPACLEAQKWIEAVTGKSFGDKDFRSALENGILLCELLSAIKPGLVRKINRLPTPIAGLDNLTVFLRGCEELGLKGSQLFDPGDLQDTSIRANLKDSDCNRKLKNVLNTVFWLGKAASGCAFYSGPTLNLKEFEGLLAQMRVESDDGATSPQNRSVRDSGYDCWDSERSESLSPPRHTRDNSLDSLDSFGSRSQHSPSPDVGNRGASDGRGSDSEADGPGRKPDVRKDDMLARRTASSESRSSIPFNQFLPNRNNATAYIPTPRRKMNAEEGEQRSHSQAIPEQTKRTGLQNKAPKTVTWAPENNGEKPKQEEQMVTQETLEQRKLQKLEKAGIKVLPAAIHHIRSVSMTDMVNEEEAGHLPLLSQSRHERMHEQYNNFQEEEDHWQDDLARWKSRRRSASQELIRKEEERKRMEKMKEERRDGNKRKSIKTYKEIVEEKERREAELCEAYRNAATPEEAALVLQRYALRFTISDATLDSLKLPRSTSKPKHDLNGTTQEDKPASPVNGSEMLEHLPKPKPASLNQKHTNPENMETDVIQELEKSGATSSSSTTSNSPVSADTNSQIVPPQSPQFCKPTTQFTESAATNQKDLNSGDTLLRSKHMSFQDAQEQSQTMQPQFPQSQPTQSKPVQLQLAQPQSEQLQPTQPQSEQPTQSQSEQPQPAQSQSEQLQPAQSEQLQPAQSQLEQMQPAQSQSEQLQPVQSHIEQLQPAQPHSEHLQPVIYTQPIHTLPSPAPARSVPMLVAKPYCQPRTTLKPVKMDGLVRVNGEMMEDSVVSPSPSALLESLQEKQENKDVSSKQAEEDNPPEEAVENPKTAEPLTPPPQNEKTAAAAASAISSLIGGRSCTITTTIVTELTQTVVEPLYPEIQSNKKTPIEEKTQAPASPSNKQKYSPTVTDGLEESCVTIETPMLNLAKRVNHWVWDPNEERKRLERWQQEQERLLQEQYLREQEKLKKEWEKAQIEVEEEERKHNEEERRILEETVTPLSPTGLLQQGSGHTAVSAPAPENNNKGEGNVSLEQNGKKVPTGREDQHASKLHFFQDSACDGQPSKRPEPWKTASLDRNPQLSQTQNVKRSGSHDAVTGEQQSSPTTPQPPSPSRCVSGKRLCSGCSKPLGKGAAMIIDTLGLYFHMGCFKCGVCKGQLGDASAGTDVRIRNGQLSCHECYIASRGRGQPTTL